MPNSKPIPTTEQVIELTSKVEAANAAVMVGFANSRESSNPVEHDLIVEIEIAFENIIKWIHKLRDICEKKAKAEAKAEAEAKAKVGDNTNES